jgi:stage IV sporulation protein B
MEKASELFSKIMCITTMLAAVLTGYYAAPDAKINTISEYYSNAAAQTAAPANRPRVIPCGTPFGIKLKSDGVMVVSVTDGSPAQKCGIKKGDIISSVNGSEVCSNDDIIAAICSSPDKCEIILERGGKEISSECVPDLDDGQYRIGAWVRDSAAGIGTLTFIDPQTGIFGGLGHGVSDVTTGDRVPLLSGEITESEIYGIIKGERGSAGELCGTILYDKQIGALSSNTPVGVFGTTDEIPDSAAVPIAFKDEVKCGEATILATIDGCEPQEYTIEIERMNILDMNGSKAMIIKITDPRLLEETGGIVRGMSGSPILQNGMLVGAVTHVLVNDPTKGYAVFAESMIDAMNG